MPFALTTLGVLARLYTALRSLLLPLLRLYRELISLHPTLSALAQAEAFVDEQREVACYMRVQDAQALEAALQEGNELRWIAKRFVCAAFFIDQITSLQVEGRAADRRRLPTGHAAFANRAQSAVYVYAFVCAAARAQIDNSLRFTLTISIACSFARGFQIGRAHV